MVKHLHNRIRLRGLGEPPRDGVDLARIHVFEFVDALRAEERVQGFAPPAVQVVAYRASDVLLDA